MQDQNGITIKGTHYTTREISVLRAFFNESIDCCGFCSNDTENMSFMNPVEISIATQFDAPVVAGLLSSLAAKGAIILDDDYWVLASDDIMLWLNADLDAKMTKLTKRNAELAFKNSCGQIEYLTVIPDVVVEQADLLLKVIQLGGDVAISGNIYAASDFAECGVAKEDWRDHIIDMLMTGRK
jgi:hypothetical protein